LIAAVLPAFEALLMIAAVLRSKRAARGEDAAGAKAAALRTRGKAGFIRAELFWTKEKV
jgi:hypothetical protein